VYYVYGIMEDLWVYLYIELLERAFLRIGCECVDFGNCRWDKGGVRVFYKLVINFGLSLFYIVLAIYVARLG